MSIANRLQSTQISPKIAGISIGCLLFLSVIGINAAKKIADGGSTAAGNSKNSSVQSSQQLDNSENSTLSRGLRIGKDKVTVKADSSDPCQVIIKRNIFRAVLSSNTNNSDFQESANKSETSGSIPPMSVSGLPSIGSYGSLGGSSSRNIAFTGVVETPEGKLALLENTSTLETRLAGVGEYAFGMEVLNINSRAVTLDSDGSDVMLALGENKSDSTTTNNQQQTSTVSSRRQRVGSFQARSQSSSSTNESQNQNQNQNQNQDSSRDQQNQSNNNGGSNNFSPPPGGFGGSFGGPPPGGF